MNVVAGCAAGRTSAAPRGEHSYTSAREGSAICGRIPRPDPQDLNIFSFERFKWGGVRRDNIACLASDLEQSARAPRLQPAPADIGLATRSSALSASCRPRPPRREPPPASR
ncbi:MAG TPA: hypothetical protein VMV07_27380 [Streptosporangiaceae bacterium]|nr:hypothetical protein [Streptosporangiaceae bacterium]